MIKDSTKPIDEFEPKIRRTHGLELKKKRFFSLKKEQDNGSTSSLESSDLDEFDERPSEQFIMTDLKICEILKLVKD